MGGAGSRQVFAHLNDRDRYWLKSRQRAHLECGISEDKYHTAQALETDTNESTPAYDHSDLPGAIGPLPNVPFVPSEISGSVDGLANLIAELCLDSKCKSAAIFASSLVSQWEVADRWVG